MNNLNKFSLHLLFILFCCSFSTLSIYAQLATDFPHDSLIHTSQDVIFTEMFENDPKELVSSKNWTTISNPANVYGDSSVPVGSHGFQSLRLVTKQDGTNPNQNLYVYKKISPDITDSIFVRYYVKYDTATRYHHSGLWLGGKNPPSSIPGNIGGTLPQGNQEFHVGTEIKGNATIKASKNSLFGLYTYWTGMHQSSSPPPNNYFGNIFPNNTTDDDIDLTTWNCIEVMIKLNNPVSSSNGKIKLWVNGKLVSDLGYQYPTGTWNYNSFAEGAGAPFEGFQFRNDNALNLNYIWLRNFNDLNANGHEGSIYFDHLVVAKKYIGPISTKSTLNINEMELSKETFIYPNPANEVVNFKSNIKNLTIFTLSGQVVLNALDVTHISIETLQEGIYFVQADDKVYKLRVRH